MYRQIAKIIRESAKNETVHALVMTGNGDFYSSGNDFVSYMMEMGSDDAQTGDEVK